MYCQIANLKKTKVGIQNSAKKHHSLYESLSRKTWPEGQIVVMKAIAKARAKANKVKKKLPKKKQPKKRRNKKVGKSSSSASAEDEDNKTDVPELTDDQSAWNEIFGEPRKGIPDPEAAEKVLDDMAAQNDAVGASGKESKSRFVQLSRYLRNQGTRKVNQQRKRKPMWDIEIFRTEIGRLRPSWAASGRLKREWQKLKDDKRVKRDWEGDKDDEEQGLQLEVPDWTIGGCENNDMVDTYDDRRLA